MALAFVLGLALTFALVIRRVTLEVPVSQSSGVSGPGQRGAAVERGAERAGSARSFTGRKVAGEDVPTG